MKDWKPILEATNDNVIDTYHHALDKYIADNPITLIDVIVRAKLPMKVFKRYSTDNIYFDKQLTRCLWCEDMIRCHQDLMNEEVTSFYFKGEYMEVFLKPEIKTEEEVKVIAGETVVGRFAKE